MRDRRDSPRRHRSGEPDDRPRGIARNVPIVFEDDDILVVDKPVGMLSAHVGGPRGEGYEGDDLFSLVKKYIRGNTKSRTRLPIFVVHRLDREVSGLIIFAKSQRALSWLKEDLRARRLHRVYHAVVEGEIPSTGPSSAGTIQNFLRESSNGTMESVAAGEATRARKPARPPRLSRKPDTRPIPPREDDNSPKLAVTHWRSTVSGHNLSLLQLRLETGRKNQIRVHMKDLGHPIVGDRRYGSTMDPLDRVCLHAAELAFTHAFTGRAVRLRSPTPAGFYKLLGVKRTDDEAAAESTEAIAAPVAPQASNASSRQDAGWDHVAEWYDKLIEEGQSDHFARVIIPGTLRLLAPTPGLRHLDVACGQGLLCRTLAQLGVRGAGVDAAPRLIEAARRSFHQQRGDSIYDFHVGDARRIPDLKLGTDLFDRASCIMALMNIEPLAPVFTGIHARLKPGATFVGVILHPAFRAPGQTSWAWDTPEGSARSAPATRGPGAYHKSRRGSPSRFEDADREDRASADARQYRRVDGYLSPGHSEIVMNPGAAASGKERVVTLTYHRPIQTYVRLLAEAGFAIDAMEEWPSLRQSQPGPRAAEENRARREIPMFLAFRARKV
jgi:23S rRNA-/tRNA-specific pseudouridylate synthase/2-polyprenyl-3-methyl-5-hydroxy-6-metoxy-1,4-benzoquinol methylase